MPHKNPDHASVLSEVERNINYCNAAVVLAEYGSGWYVEAVFFTDFGQEEFFAHRRTIFPEVRHVAARFCKSPERFEVIAEFGHRRMGDFTAEGEPTDLGEDGMVEAIENSRSPTGHPDVDKDEIPF